MSPARRFPRIRIAIVSLCLLALTAANASARETAARRAAPHSAAASAAASSSPAPLQIIASFSVLGDMARQIGGDHVEVHTLAGPDTDAQSYKPTDDDIAAVSRADLILANGLGYDAWMNRLVRAAETEAPVIVASRGIKPRATESGATSPYAWLSAANGKQYAINISEALEDLARANAEPERAQAIRLRATRYLDDLDDADRKFREATANIPADRRIVVTGRDAFAYLAAACDLTALPYDATDAPAAIKAHGIKHIFLDGAHEPRPVMMLAADTGTRLGGALFATLSPMDGPAPTYLALLRHNASNIAKAMAENAK